MAQACGPGRSHQNDPHVSQEASRTSRPNPHSGHKASSHLKGKTLRLYGSGVRPVLAGSWAASSTSLVYQRDRTDKPGEVRCFTNSQIMVMTTGRAARSPGPNSPVQAPQAHCMHVEQAGMCRGVPCCGETAENDWLNAQVSEPRVASSTSTGPHGVPGQP
jgi:hypothetical protein